ncbi:DUF1285 domain-containing protein [Qipengyuania sp. DGS5-3]|uniref:DUF1285 domain-containing protein n=1 Tax=Qipengyuania sp. DGS5-3 TaxID=3349632 RepID=UPI0036D230E0
MPYEPPPELASLSLAEVARQVADRKLPPVEGWAPQRTGESHMRIAADGTWYHEGSAIKRPAMVRAFAGLLTRDENAEHWLVTPFEKLTITVDDAAFIAVDCQEADGGIAFRLNTDDLVIAGADNPLIARGDPDQPAFYVAVRRGCEARLNRSTYEQLAQIALARGDDWSVASQGMDFSLIPA